MNTMNASIFIEKVGHGILNARPGPVIQTAFGAHPAPANRMSHRSFDDPHDKRDE